MTTTRRLFMAWLALTLGMLLVLPAAAQRPDRIKIGGTVAVTGRFSSDWGPGIVEFMKGWEKLVNAEGGVMVKEYNAKLPVELVLYDDESSPEKSVELYEKLNAVDKVHLFIGPGSSPITLRASTVAERLKIPMLLVEANSPIIYSRGFQWIAGVDRPAQYWAGPYFDLVKELREKNVAPYRTIAFLVEDHPHTKDVAEDHVGRMASSLDRDRRQAGQGLARLRLEGSHVAGDENIRMSRHRAVVVDPDASSSIGFDGGDGL